MSDRITRPRHLLSALTLLSVVGSVVVVLTVVVWVATAPPVADLRRDGDRMVEAVEQYRRVSGRYPESLEEAGVVPPECPYAPWRYVYYDDGHYRLSVGDHDRDGFVLTYRSASGKWYLDD